MDKKQQERKLRLSKKPFVPPDQLHPSETGWKEVMSPDMHRNQRACLVQSRGGATAGTRNRDGRGAAYCSPTAPQVLRIEMHNNWWTGLERKAREENERRRRKTRDEEGKRKAKEENERRGRLVARRGRVGWFVQLGKERKKEVGGETLLFIQK